MKSKVFLAVSVLVTGLLMFYIHQHIKPQQQIQALYGNVIDFSLLDENGQVFSREKLSNKIWVANFIFTRCKGQCPLLSLEMAALQERYQYKDDFDLASFSVDPEYDRPEMLKAYAARYKADTRHWHFLTGTQPQIDALLTKGFKIGSTENPNYHSTRLVLVDRMFCIRGYYDAEDPPSLKQLYTDINRVLKEVPEP